MLPRRQTRQIAGDFRSPTSSSRTHKRADHGRGSPNTFDPPFLRSSLTHRPSSMAPIGFLTASRRRSARLAGDAQQAIFPARAGPGAGAREQLHGSRTCRACRSCPRQHRLVWRGRGRSAGASCPVWRGGACVPGKRQGTRWREQGVCTELPQRRDARKHARRARTWSLCPCVAHAGCAALDAAARQATPATRTSAPVAPCCQPSPLWPTEPTPRCRGCTRRRSHRPWLQLQRPGQWSAARRRTQRGDDNRRWAAAGQRRRRRMCGNPPRLHRHRRRGVRGPLLPRRRAHPRLRD